MRGAPSCGNVSVCMFGLRESVPSGRIRRRRQGEDEGEDEQEDEGDDEGGPAGNRLGPRFVDLRVCLSVASL